MQAAEESSAVFAATSATLDEDMRGMSERLEAWVRLKDQEIDLNRQEEKMEPDLAEKIYELDRCIECGCCIAGCGTLRMREDFVSAAGLNKIARFRLDPRDRRSDEDFYELIGDDNGVFGCMSLPRLPRCLSEKPTTGYADSVSQAKDGRGWMEIV